MINRISPELAGIEIQLQSHLKTNDEYVRTNSDQ
jgi:hypothetical protein